MVGRCFAGNPYPQMFDIHTPMCWLGCCSLIFRLINIFSFVFLSLEIDGVLASHVPPIFLFRHRLDSVMLGLLHVCNIIRFKFFLLNLIRFPSPRFYNTSIHVSSKFVYKYKDSCYEQRTVYRCRRFSMDGGEIRFDPKVESKLPIITVEIL